MTGYDKILVKGRVQYLILLIVFTSYLVILHQGLARPDPQPSQGLTVLRERAEMVRRRCEKFRSDQRLEWSALYHNHQINTCTNVFFTLNSRRFQLCNILKGGSMSWKMFFKLNQIPHQFLADCPPGLDCRSEQRRLVQVRHPFERLLSAWRHIFQAEGFTTLWSISPVDQQLLHQGGPVTTLLFIFQPGSHKLKHCFHIWNFAILARPLLPLPV